MDFEIPFRELGFSGVPHRSTAFIMPTVHTTSPLYPGLLKQRLVRDNAHWQTVDLWLPSRALFMCDHLCFAAIKTRATDTSLWPAQSVAPAMLRGCVNGWLPAPSSCGPRSSISSHGGHRAGDVFGGADRDAVHGGRLR